MNVCVPRRCPADTPAAVHRPATAVLCLLMPHNIRPKRCACHNATGLHPRANVVVTTVVIYNMPPPLPAAGNAAYKAKRFEEAVGHYTKAMALYPEDISFLTNRAAVHFETGDYEACIKVGTGCASFGFDL